MNDRAEHISKAFDEELRQLDNRLAEMGGMVEAQLAGAVEALRRGNTELAEQVVARDRDIDALDIEIDLFSVRLVALRQPVAADLRTIFAAIRISSDLERIGDMAKNIAKRTHAVSRFPPLATTASIASMARVVQTMIKQVLDAWTARDTEAAADVFARDTEVDQHYASLFRELLTYMMEDPRNIGPCTHLLFVAKNLERVGDHTTNIAEQIGYAVLGTRPPDRETHDPTNTLVPEAEGR